MTKVKAASAMDALSVKAKATGSVVTELERMLAERGEVRIDALNLRERAKAVRGELTRATVDARLGDEAAKKRAAELLTEAARLDVEASTLETAATELDRRIAEEYDRIFTSEAEFSGALLAAILEAQRGISDEAQRVLESMAPLVARAAALYRLGSDVDQCDLATALPGWWGGVEVALGEAMDLDQVAEGDGEAQRLRSVFAPAFEMRDRARKTLGTVRTLHDQHAAALRGRTTGAPAAPEQPAPEAA